MGGAIKGGVGQIPVTKADRADINQVTAGGAVAVNVNMGAIGSDDIKFSRGIRWLKILGKPIS